jgi:hypothetical protein
MTLQSDCWKRLKEKSKIGMKDFKRGFLKSLNLATCPALTGFFKYQIIRKSPLGDLGAIIKKGAFETRALKKSL